MMHSFSSFPIITTDRLILRKIDLNDDKEIFFERSDETMNKYIDRPLAKSIDDAREWIIKIANEHFVWGITLKDKNTLIGGFCFWNFSEDNTCAEIGFGLHPEHWGKGFMQEVLERAIQFGFQELALKTIEAYTHPDNVRSVKLLERNRFKLKPGQQIQPDSKYVVFTLSAETM